MQVYIGMGTLGLSLQLRKCNMRLHTRGRWNDLDSNLDVGTLRLVLGASLLKQFLIKPVTDAELHLVFCIKKKTNSIDLNLKQTIR